MSTLRKGLGLLALLWPLALPAAPPAAADSWLIEAQRELVQREYRASINDQGLQAPNRAQGFRSYFDGQGIRIVTRDAGAAPLAALALSGVGREARGATPDSLAAGVAEVSSDASQVTLRWPGIVASYLNSDRGLLQQLSVARPPSGPGRLSVAWMISAATLQVDTDGVLLRSRTTTLRLGAIAAQDAEGRNLPISVTAQAQRLLLAIDDRRAAYPITIKTLISGIADARLEPNQTNALFGYSVAGAGDVNGDGYADVIVGALYYDNGQADEGAAFVYFGGAGAFNTGADALLEANQSGAWMGRSVAAAGDVNGDGYADVIVGAPFFDNGQSDEGAAFVYFGGVGAFDATSDAQLEANQANALLGYSSAGAGDVNGDGYADVIVGATNYDGGQEYEGAAFIYFGSAGAFNTSADAQLESNQIGAAFGRSVAGAGDLNGDGYADVIVGAELYDNGEPEEGAAFVYFGGGGAFDSSADAQLEPNQSGAAMGWGVGAAGDVNGDGYADVIVGAPFYDNGQVDEGAAFVYFGSAGAFNSSADAQLEADQANAQMGYSVAGVGDVNGDGYADVIVGAYDYDNGENSEGAAFVYFGGVGVFDSGADAQLESNQAAAEMGSSVAGAGDVNGDGYADVIVGASLYDNGQNDEGAAFLYFGGAAAFNSSAAALLETNQAIANLGYSVAGAGDVNGDGFADVIVGAPYFDNGHSDEGAAFVYFGGTGAPDTNADAQLESNQALAYLGFSVAGAGDVNGDGFADVIVGAYDYDNGQVNEGAAFVYFGGNGAFDTNADALLESNQVAAEFGWSVAGAGDVNGDGYADVIVGALNYDNGDTDEGAAFVYFGGSGAFNSSPDALLEVNQALARMGWSVAGAGDVNGDGYADVIVGIYTFDNGQPDEGAALLYFGGAGAFNLIADAQLEADQMEGRMGYSVASAGDVNGDGYADVIVGAAAYDNGQNEEGAAFIYLGGAGAFDLGADTQLESNQERAFLGYSVAGAGDVNGDGYADVIVGALNYDNGETDEGAAFVFLGGPDVFDTSADARLESNQAYAQLGWSVAGVGDLNGDGSADVIAGAVNYANGETTEGAAFVYLGSARGRLVLASQFRGNGSAPVEPWGLSQQADGFVVSIEATSAVGRERARLQVEACPAGAAFGTANCVIRSANTWTDVGTHPLGVTLVLPISGLSLDQVYHWRARVQHAAFSVTAPGIVAPPNPAFGPWRRLQANAQVADIRTSLPEPIFANGFE